jgi:hypothetical protein
MTWVVTFLDLLGQELSFLVPGYYNKLTNTYWYLAQLARLTSKRFNHQGQTFQFLDQSELKGKYYTALSSSSLLLAYVFYDQQLSLIDPLAALNTHFMDVFNIINKYWFTMPISLEEEYDVVENEGFECD